MKMESILKFLGPTFLSLKEFGFAYGVQGILLRRNLEKFWFIDCVTMSKYNVFHTPSNTLIASLKDLKDIGLTSNLPFGICEIDEVKNTWNESLLPPKSKPITHRIAKVTTVYESDDTIGSVKDLFYKKQRERKSWWRRISQNPSIYYMTEVKKEKRREYSEIQARFEDTVIVIETVNYKKNAKNFLPNTGDAEFKSDLMIVEHTMSLDWGCLTLLIDGYTEYKGNKELQVHPRLSPYKAYCKAIISPDDDERTKNDLNDLTLFVIHKLREEGVESVIMNNIEKPEIFQVPYIITVDKETLKTGLLKMVSQRTWCGEIVHITHLAKRMNELCV
ncbi:DNA polymerase subunit gamma-2, mitochondrial [Phymastichus coffea]|uniref:DNA polymerase subunit gamma-2, mitochondrial n=1 Tax=Phymastichus coffea TaxID=108790 RepID=UPI00273ACA8F|nr:DNA polymerase subunit gamma-2, mitochondrial [Phymastichus coffea]